MNSKLDVNVKKYSNHSQEKLDRKTTKKVLLRLTKYVFKHWKLFILAIIFTLASNQLALMGPEYSGNAIDAINNKGGVDFDSVYYNVVMMLICYIISGVLAYILAVTMIKLSQKIVYTMRKEVFEKLNTLPVTYFDKNTTGDIISRISYDVDTINSTLSHDLVQVMTSVYTVIGALIFMIRISIPMLIIFCITVPVSIIFTKYRSKKVRPLFRKRTRALGELNGFAEEMLSGVSTIRAYGTEDVISKRFNEHNNSAMDDYYKADYYGAALGPGVNFINNLSVSMIMILGGILYMFSSNGTVAQASIFFITLGGVSKFVLYSRKFAGPINEFANILHELQSCFSAAERIFRLIDEEPEPKDVENPLPLDNVVGKVEVKNLNFGYTADKLILKNISFTADPGKTVAIVGPTGAGKTTIINLLMRFYDANSGSIELDGKNILHLPRKKLRKAYTMVLQDTWLFSGTILENIRYGKENATFEEVCAAAKAAKIHNFIESLPSGYNTMITDDGVNISKGQKQLITIARAMLSDAPMLILDEATSNVDSRTEIKIQEAMAKLMQGRTSFVIAHRLSTIEKADLILVIEGGTITESGTHAQLMQKGGFYSALYNSQYK